MTTTTIHCWLMSARGIKENNELNQNGALCGVVGEREDEWQVMR
jgi:hypothetical protein